MAAVGAMAEKAKCPLTVCPLLENRQDLWIQVGAGWCPAPARLQQLRGGSPHLLQPFSRTRLNSATCKPPTRPSLSSSTRLAMVG